jgi:NADH:ubiquinone oxidoreductase subunit 6 (subunit J)
MQIDKAFIFEVIVIIFAVLAIVFQDTVYSGLAIAFSIFAVDGHFRQKVIKRD